MKCFEYHGAKGVNCLKTNCRYWIESKNHSNCCIVGSTKKESVTLEDIGKIFSVTRMRICQIEKIAISKIRDKILSIVE